MNHEIALYLAKITCFVYSDMNYSKYKNTQQKCSCIAFTILGLFYMKKCRYVIHLRCFGVA